MDTVQCGGGSQAASESHFGGLILGPCPWRAISVAFVERDLQRRPTLGFRGVVVGHLWILGSGSFVDVNSFVMGLEVGRPRSEIGLRSYMVSLSA